MQVLKKIVSLLLVAAMISSLALVAFAADETGTATPNVVLEAYKADGSALGASESVKVGDTIKVKLKTTEALECATMNIYVTYDSEVLEADKTNSKLGDIASKFMMSSVNVATSGKDDVKQGLTEGTPIVLATLANPTANVAVDANTEWAEFAFTVKSVSDATKLQVVIKTASRLSGIDPEAISSLVPGDLTLSVKAAPSAIESITLSRTAYTLSEYKTYRLNATVYPEDAQVTWESGDPAVATVDQTGLVTCVSHENGAKTTITAKAGDKSATCTITVKVVPATSITLSDVSVNLGNSATLNAKFKPYSNTSKPATTWKVIEGSDIVELTGTGASVTVTGKKTGTATVQATLGGLKPATCVVSVINPVTNVDITGPGRMLVGSTAQLTADVKIANDTAESTDDTTVMWSSQNPEIATVDENGNVTAKSNVGAATITAKVAAKEATHVVYVVTQVKDTYVVSMPQDETIAAGADVSIPVTVGRGVEGVSHYSAFDMIFTYDPAVLELKTTAIDGYEVRADAAAGTVRVIGYGDPKAFGTAFTLGFAAKQVAGDTTVKLVTAKVDISENALAADAPDAKITDSDTKLTVEVRHSVTLPEEMQGNNWVVSGTDYTFSVKNYDPFYNYTVTATMNGTAVSVIDNGDGTFTISNVSGDLVIAMNSVGKSYTVTFAGNGAGDIAKNTVKTATYGTPYEFTINKDDSYAYTVTAAIGEASVNVAASNTDGTYQIAGTEIKGNIVITITKELKNPDEVNVVVEGTGAKDVTADSKAAKGTDFIFKVKKESGYIYEVKITINGSEYSDATFVEAEDGIVTYTIPGTAITGMIVIEVTKDEAVNVTFENTNKAEIKVVKADGRTSLADGHDIVKKGADYVFKVNSFKRVYTLTVEVTENEQTKTYTEDIPVAGNSDTRLTHTITIPNVQGNLNIKLSCVANDDMVEVVVNPYVELDGKTVYIIATRTKEGYQQGIKLDTYDGYAMYTTDLYIGQFTSPLTGSGSTFLWLVTVDKDETFTKDEALRHLTYTNHRDPANANKPLPKPDGIGNDGDVNGSNLIDVNDAQLVYDIYKGAYQSFYMTNTDTKNDTHVDPNYGIGASMTKFLEADVNRNMKVDIHDAADIINLIK